MAEKDAKPTQFCAAGIQPPPKFDFANPSEWTEWVLLFDDYCYASGLYQAPGEVQVRTLLYAMGSREARRLLDTLALTSDDWGSLEAVKKKLTDHFIHPANEVYESVRFHRRVQAEGESVDDFYTALRTLVKKCNYASAEVEERLVRDRFVVGLLDSTLVDKLCRTPRLSLDDARLQARIHEDAVKARSEVFQKELNPGHVVSEAKVRKRLPKSRQRSDLSGEGTKSTSKPRSGDGRCRFCGRLPHPRSECPAKEARCRWCKKVGHFEAVCEKKAMGSVELHTVASGAHTRAKFVNVAVNGHNVNFKVDSGAEVTVVSSSFPGVPRKLQRPDGELTGPGDHPLKVLGKFPATLQWRGTSTVQDIYVMPSQHPPLLGFPAIQALGVIQFVDNVATPAVLRRDSLFEGLGELKEEYVIRLRPGAKPFALSVPRRVPIPLHDVVREELQKLESEGVIRKVDHPTDWCAGMVVVPKTGGGYRICVDLTRLNEVVLRERHILPSVENILGRLGQAKVFSKLDATAGFHQVKLSEESQELTTFITPMGRFCFRRLPFGICSAPEYFERQMSRILEGLEGVVSMIDDILVFGTSKDEHDRRLQQVLQRLDEAGIKLNKKKCSFAATQVKFLGVLVSARGISPDPEKIEALEKLPIPSDVSGVRRLLGMANHVGRFIPHLSDVTAPIRALLQQRNSWCWGPSQQAAFEKIKSTLSSDICMAKYDPSFPTVVSADASSYGLGAVLLQDQPSGERRAVAYASRALTTTESRYGQIEKEALAVTWAVERFDQFLRGIDFQVETDHRPLVTLLGSAELDLMPPRIQRLRIRLMRYQFTVLYVPGKLIATADTLSRAPVQELDPRCQRQVDSIELFVGEVVSAATHFVSSRLEALRTHQAEDGICSGLQRFCEKGWPEHESKVPVHLREYWKERGNITVCGGFLLKDRRIIIPRLMRHEILQLIHEGHQGIGRCKARARDAVWWPTLNSEIDQLVTACERCAQTRVQRSEPLISTPTPSRPWQRVGADLFELEGRHYVLVVDYYSRFPEVISLTSTASTSVVAAVKSTFARFGIPDVLVSDNGPQFSSKVFAEFAQNYGFQHVTSSPRYPQANGEAERMVRTLKELFYKSGDPHMALLVYRDTPGVTGYSPSQLLMGRRLQTKVPKLPEMLQPEWPSRRDFKKKDGEARRRQRNDFNRRHAARQLRPLSVGEDVWVQDVRCRATVLSPAKRPRSYVVETETGVLQRNRRHLVPFDASPAVSVGQGPGSLTNKITSPAGPAVSTAGTSPGAGSQQQLTTAEPALTAAQPGPAPTAAPTIVTNLPSTSTESSMAENTPIRVTRSGRQVRRPVRLNL